MENNQKIAIIGAGIQGVCAGLFLLKKGYQVTLFDRNEPGNAASYGNAGHFSPYASVPLNRPDILTDIPSMLISSRGPLALKWNYLPKSKQVTLYLFEYLFFIFFTHVPSSHV